LVRTEHDALELVRTHFLVTEVPALGVRSLAEAVAGERITGSWRGHAKGRLIYRLGRVLRASDQVLTVRLVEGKVTFVDRSIWAEIYRIAMEPTRRRRSLEGLSDKARELLSLVERDHTVSLRDDVSDEVPDETLELRLLVHVSARQGADKRPITVLRSWRGWASDELKQVAADLTYEGALERIRGLCGGAPGGLGPWVP
jgi:hypothetical protein